MTWTCGACTTVNAEDAGTCVVCHLARGSADQPTVPVATVSPAPPVAPAAPPVGPPNANAAHTAHTARSADAIAAPAGSASAPAPGRGPWAAVAVAVVVVVALVGIGIGLVLAGGGSDGGTDGASADETAATAGPGADGTSADDSEEAVATDGATSAPTTQPTTTVPSADALPSDRWVTVLYSRSKAEYSLDQVRAEAEQVAASHGGDPRVRVIDSDAAPVMNAGYWAIVLVDFDSREEAIGWCDAFGIEKGPCNPLQTLTGQR